MMNSSSLDEPGNPELCRRAARKHGSQRFPIRVDASRILAPTGGGPRRPLDDEGQHRRSFVQLDQPDSVGCDWQPGRMTWFVDCEKDLRRPSPERRATNSVAAPAMWAMSTRIKQCATAIVAMLDCKRPSSLPPPKTAQTVRDRRTGNVECGKIVLRHTAAPSTSATASLIVAPLPVTSARRAFLTCRAPAPPRSCRTASTTCVMPPARSGWPKPICPP